MEPSMAGDEAIDHDDLAVRNWRAAQLKRLRIPGPLAEVSADHPRLASDAPARAGRLGRCHGGRAARPAQQPHLPMTPRRPPGPEHRQPEHRY